MASIVGHAPCRDRPFSLRRPFSMAASGNPPRYFSDQHSRHAMQNVWHSRTCLSPSHSPSPSTSPSTSPSPHTCHIWYSPITLALTSQPHPHSLPGWLAIGASGAILIDEGGGDSPYGRWRASPPPPFASHAFECARGLSRAYSSLHWSAVPLQLLRRATITHGKACAGGLLFTLFTVVCTAGGVELIARDWQLRWLLVPSPRQWRRCVR